MIRLIKITCLALLLNACFKTKQANNSEQQTSLTISNEKSNEISKKQQYFTNVEDFKKFISTKWIALLGDEPCGSFERTISFKKDHLYEYTGMEPEEHKIDEVKLIDSRTLDIKIQNDLNRDIIYRVEILNFKEKLIKWTVNGEVYYEKTKPYNIVCKGWGDYTEEEKVSKENSFTEKWEGFYQFSDAKEGDDWRAGSDYDLYISLDSVNLNSHGYQHDRNRKSYAIEKKGSLFVYSQEPDEDLLLKLAFKNNEYIATSLIDREGEFKVMKKD